MVVLKEISIKRYIGNIIENRYPSKKKNRGRKKEKETKSKNEWVPIKYSIK